MNYVDSNGVQLSPASISYELQNFEIDLRTGRIEKLMSFEAYVTKYLGWKTTTGENQ